MPESLNKLFCFVFIIVGVVLLLGNLITGYQTLKFVENAASAAGKVVKLNGGSSHPQIAFTTAENEEIQYPQNGLIGGYEAGDEVKILYDSRNPKNASLDTFGALWGFNLLGIILSVVFIGVGGFKLLYPNFELSTPNV